MFSPRPSRRATFPLTSCTRCSPKAMSSQTGRTCCFHMVSRDLRSTTETSRARFPGLAVRHYYTQTSHQAGYRRYIADYTNCIIGRSLSQCKGAFDSLRHLPRPPSQLPTPQPQPQPFHTPNPVFTSAPNKRQSMTIMPGPDTKRRKSGAETPTSSHMMIAPKPSNGSQMAAMTSTPTTNSNQKKRGRPSKADVERKQKEAIERGEVILPSPAASSPSVIQGQEGVRSGSFAPVTIALAPPGPSPQAVMTPAQLSSPQMATEGQSMAVSGETGAKRRKPRLPPQA